MLGAAEWLYLASLHSKLVYKIEYLSIFFGKFNLKNILCQSAKCGSKAGKLSFQKLLKL
jgi:hypothetical protein